MNQCPKCGADGTMGNYECGSWPRMGNPTDAFIETPTCLRRQLASMKEAEVTLRAAMHHQQDKRIEADRAFAAVTAERDEFSKRLCALAGEVVEICGIAIPLEDAMTWRTIDSAPKDGTEILAWREDCGVVIAAWTCQSNLMTDDEIERADLGDSADDCDWFSAYGFGCDWMSGGEAPTYWLPMPAGPALKGAPDADAS